MQENKLVKAPNGQLEIKKACETASAISLVRMLNLAASVTGYKELTEAENRLWLKLLTPYPAERIEQAFEKFLERAEFFPKPAEILAYLHASAEEVNAQRELDRTAAMLAENRQTRDKLKAAGLPYGIEQYNASIEELKQIVKLIPEPIPGKREAIKRRIDAIQAYRLAK